MGGPPLIDLNCENPRLKRYVLVEVDSFAEDGEVLKQTNRTHMKSMQTELLTVTSTRNHQMLYILTTTADTKPSPVSTKMTKRTH